FVGNQANIYGDPQDKETSGLMMPVLSADWAFKYYRGALPSEKILMGVPYYTRGWENVQPGPNGTGLNGTSNTPATGKYNTLADLDANGNPIPAGVNNLWHVMNLMEQDPNLKVHWDEVGKVPYIWHENEKVFLTFENEQSIDERLKYIEEHNLGGALIWTMDGDYGLNPNYVEGSTDINEGKYTFGNTLTKRFANGLKAMGPANKSPEDNAGLEKIGVEVEQSGTYDHPNYTYDFKVTNHTGEKIEGGWEIAFDLPKSAKFKSTWGGTFTEEDKGDFTRITLKSSGWQTLEPGASTNLQGMIGLCFSGVRNVTFNGMNPVGKDAPTPPEQNQAPVIKGATDKTINVGDSFDKLAGVTASDKEDGDLTSSIKVSGNIDTNTAGIYQLTYSVIDSKGLTTTSSRTITVKSTSTEVDTYDQNKTYYGGEIVIYKGQEYKAKWWVQGEAPDTSQAWEKIVSANEDGSISYEPGMVFVGGEIVRYEGKTYKAKWWTNTAPGSDGSWELIG
ncbi:MAG: glycosyl hydrolase family 18 protein, partial [Romboutsia sp.]|uniref:glycosyl hydrolase family 18 protein n=1 Tax=Romboutsia sp. TaxID=1965302 RepID=UPI003F3CF7C5